MKPHPSGSCEVAEAGAHVRQALLVLPESVPRLTIRNRSASFVDLDTIPETVILSRALDSDGDGEAD